MASVILCNGNYRTSDNYSITMIHNASGDTNDSVLNAINSSIQTIYKDRTHLNGDVANELMNKETFMDCKMSLENGFIDEIVETGKKVKLPKSKTVQNLALIYNALLTTKKMDKITASLGIENESTEEKVVESIEELKAKLKIAEDEKIAKDAELAELQTKLDAIKVAEDSKKEAEVVSTVENAISKGWAKAELKDSLIEMGNINLSTLNKLFESASKATVATMVFKPKDETNPNDTANWTIMDWQKKDPKGLTKIKNETPEIYTMMYDNYYKLGIGKPTKK